MHTSNRLLLLLLSLLPVRLFAQSSDSLMKETRKDLSILCSDNFAGRGYVQNGHKKAAIYLQNRLSQIGVKPSLSNAYFQPFSIWVNVPQKAHLYLNHRQMKPGIDFIVNGQSASGKGRTWVTDTGYGLTKDDKIEGQAVVFTEGFPPEISNDPKRKEAFKSIASTYDRIHYFAEQSPAMLLIRKTKLTMAYDADTLDFPVLEVLESSVPTDLKDIRWSVETVLQPIETQNVIGKIEGKIKDTCIIVCAHYDHMGKLNSAVFSGANDNASGVSMLLSIARYFVLHPPKYTLLISFFGAEETGLEGARYYVENPIYPLKQTKFILNLDLMGGGSQGLMAVAGTDFPKEFQKLTQLNESRKAVTQIKSRPNAPNSDHYPFIIKGVKGFFIYSLGDVTAYHDVFDRPEKLDLTHFEDIRSLLIAFLEQL